MWRVFCGPFLFVFSFLWGQRSGEQLQFTHLHSFNISLCHNSSLAAFNSPSYKHTLAVLKPSSILSDIFGHRITCALIHLLLGGYLCALEKQLSYSVCYTKTVLHLLMFTRCLLWPTVGITARVCPSPTPTPCGGKWKSSEKGCARDARNARVYWQEGNVEFQ